MWVDEFHKIFSYIGSGIKSINSQQTGNSNRIHSAGKGSVPGDCTMSKKESDDAAIALKKKKERVRIAAYRAANPEKVKASVAKYRVSKKS